MTEYICMPLKTNVPIPRNDWKSAICPMCKVECWESPMTQKLLDLSSNYKSVCTLCALKMGVKNECKI